MPRRAHLLLPLALALALALSACADGTSTGTRALDAPGSQVGDDPADLDAGDAEADDDAPPLDDADDALDGTDATGDADADTPDADTPDAADAAPDAPDDGLVALDPEGYAVNEQRFPLGVQAGGMEGDRALLWTYVAGAAPKTLLVWQDTGEAGQIEVAWERLETPDADGYLKVEVTGLTPGERYRYAFFDGQDRSFSSRSPIGQVRASLPADSTAPVTIGATTCTKFSRAPYQALSLMAEEPMDAFVAVGDMSYNDDATTLEAYRDLWRQTLTDPGYRDILPHAGLYATWDDHEITNNFDPETLDPDRLAAAKNAYFETLAVDRGEGDRLWHSYAWGRSVEFIVLDSRSERRPSTRGTFPSVYLGPSQMEWLKERLADSPAHFKVILNSVPITDMPPLWLAQGDRWEGYPSQRDELLDFIVNQDVRNVWFLAGDFHAGFVSRVEASGPRSRIREIAVGPGDNGPNPLAAAAELGDQSRQNVFPDDQFDYGSSAIAVATFLTFDPESDSVHVRFVDATTEEVLFDEVLREE